MALREGDQFAVIAIAYISDFGTEAVGQALNTRLRATRQMSSTYLISRSLIATTILSSLMFLLFFCSSALAQSEPPGQPPRESDLPNAPEPRGAAQPQQHMYGIVSGGVVDQNGIGVAGAHVKLMQDESMLQEGECDEDGQFIFVRVPPGPLTLTISAEGFATKTVSNTLPSGENYVFPEITLLLATQITEIRVTPSMEEIAQEQFKDLEKQRVLGFVPNFYVSYLGEAAPLSSSQKFNLALKATADPVTDIWVGVVAARDQAADRFSGYGQGAQGYAKRYGASYANFASGLFIGGAVLPSLLKQDPRYYYKGTGARRSRFLYAVSRTFICKGDNQRWQPNYSLIVGYVAAGGISNLYVPDRDRHGASLTLENAAMGIGGSAVINVLQEFVLHRFTSKR